MTKKRARTEEDNRRRREAYAAARVDDSQHWLTERLSMQVKWDGICTHSLTKAKHSEICWMALSGETARLAVLFADEEKNPASYCTRVAAVPECNVCAQCHVAGGLLYHKDFWGAYYVCQLCGADYFPDAEPVPVLISGRAAGAYSSGRHDDAQPVGERYVEYDKAYKNNKRNEQRRKNVTA